MDWKSEFIYDFHSCYRCGGKGWVNRLTRSIASDAKTQRKALAAAIRVLEERKNERTKKVE